MITRTKQEGNYCSRRQLAFALGPLQFIVRHILLVVPAAEAAPAEAAAATAASSRPAATAGTCGDDGVLAAAAAVAEALDPFVGVSSGGFVAVAPPVEAAAGGGVSVSAAPFVV